MSKLAETENWLPLFKDSHLNKCLREDGIVKVPLEGFDVKSANDFLKKTVPNYPHQYESSFYASVCISDMNLKRELQEGLLNIVSPFMNSIIENHRVLSYFFLIKSIGVDSTFSFHQDWSIVDERKFRAYTLWIPLVDSTLKNGTIHAIKGSHRFPLNIRGAGIPSKYFGNRKEADKHLEPFEVKAGEALIFDSRILHYSPPNLSDSSRTSIISNIIPNEAETICYHGVETENELKITSYAVPDDFFIYYDDFNNQKDNPNPKGGKGTYVDYGNTELVSSKDFNLLIKKYIPSKKRSFFF